MPLWRGLATMQDPHRDISFWVEIAGSHGTKVWDFKKQTYIKTYVLKNVPTFILDSKNPFFARSAEAISASVTLKCEKTPNGLLTCTKTSTEKKPVLFNKVIYLHPLMQTPVKIKRFTPFGSIIYKLVVFDNPKEIEKNIPFNLIPFTKELELPVDMILSRTPTDTEDEEPAPGNVIPKRLFDIHMDRVSSDSAATVSGDSGQNSADETESILEAGILHAQDSGEVNLPLGPSGSRPPNMNSFAPLATSTTEETRQPTQGADAIRPPLADLLEAGPSSAPTRSQSFPPTRKSSRLASKTTERVVIGRVTKKRPRKWIILKHKGKPYYQT